MADEEPRVISRRDILRRVGAAGAAVAVPAAFADAGQAAQTGQAGQGAQAARPPLASQAAPPAAPVREAFENLTAAESDLLEAIVERLIPSDAHGPGAKEARVAHYIDRALGGALASSRAAYTAGLAAVDRYAISARGTRFAQLSAADRDAVLAECEAGTATGFANGSAPFFAMLLTHTRQGMFGDPYYGGNANFVGWDLLGYPGVRTMVSAADQTALEAGDLKPVRRSAYDYDGFNKATASAHTTGDGHHGD